LTLSSSGPISGTPTTVGTSNFTVQVTDSSSPAQTATQALSITIAGSGGSQNNIALSGNYAFTFTGISGSGGNSSVFAAVGRFAADGAGNLTGGELDTNGVGSGTAVIAQAFTGTYMIGADGRGVMTWNFSGSTAKLAFAMMANGNAKFIKFDASGGSGTIGSGTIEKVDATAFNTTKILGDYAFGLAGLDGSNNRVALAGRFTSSGAGALASAAGDVNAYGSVSSMSFSSATYVVSDTTTGRGTMSFSFQFAGGADTLNFVFYIVNAGKIFVMENDPVTTATPLLSGTLLQQQTPSGGFSSASLNGNMVIYLTGLSLCANITGPVSKAVAGLLTADGIGALTLTYDENFCRAPNSVTGAPGTYIVSSNGRISMNLGSDGVVAYLVDQNHVFLFSTDTSVLSGFGEPQATGSLTNSAVNGTYAGVADSPDTFGVAVFSGEFTADGGIPTGNISGTKDIGSSSGPTSAAAFNATYSISSSPTNGRGSVTLTSGSGGTAIAYVISPSKFVMVPMSDPNPAVWIFEQASAGSVVQLSSLSLNPATAVGGAQSSSGTVTLSGPAPTGGAQVTLSSSNTSVVTVPSSVTVGAGATSTTFTVSTSVVSASTAVTISASYGGQAQTASLTVTPAPPPPPTLSSLTLNPTSVVGGAQTSTGTVSLSRAALAGGAQVTLSSNNTSVATVPSSVTVGAGATSTTFAVSTSAVSASTAVTISASYGGQAQTATLTVNVVPPSITAQPVNQTVTAGQTANFTVVATGTAPLNYQWQRGGVAIPAANSSTYTTPATTTSDTGAQFTVVVSNSAGSVTSTPATLTVNPPLPTVSSLTLNPASVVGGSQSSTATVTLSGPAPAGGALVAVSSSNAAAKVPSSVTILAGATGATFTISSSTVTASTGVTISASYNGVSRTASLTVMPLPLPTVSSLTLNPTGVVGGLQSSTGTVTLSGPAPAGGAQVTLSSSNSGVARVPSSVTVPAGATSATFTVNTSVVLISTSATISASYNGTTKTAILAVLL
jgi:hypothetical protein